jgi:hypothetical protein
VQPTDRRSPASVARVERRSKASIVVAHDHARIRRAVDLDDEYSTINDATEALWLSSSPTCRPER